MKQTGLKICLLGGSNSVLSYGIRRGLAAQADLRNLAHGGSTSLQNIFALTCAHEEIVTDVDAIVTESNVNDAHAVLNAELSIETVKSNIHKLHRELALTGKPTISIVVPVRQYGPGVPPTELVEQIYRCHMTAAKKYGIHVIDLDRALHDFSMEHPLVRIIIPHSYHPMESFMYELGLNVTTYFAENKPPPARRDFKTNFRAVLPAGLGHATRRKSNSLFEKDVFDLTSPLSLNVTDGVCVGISTWCDEPGEIIVTADNIRVVKQFGTNLMFNEFQQPLSGRLTMASTIGQSAGVTERSINVTHKAAIGQAVSVSGFLVETNGEIEPTTVTEHHLLDHLIPPIDIHIHSAERVVKNIAVLPTEHVNLIKYAAEQLEKHNLKLALSVMRLAARHAPKNREVREKIEAYKSRLDRKGGGLKSLFGLTKSP